MKIKCVKIEKCPICGEKGSIQVFFNKQNEIKYARVRHYARAILVFLSFDNGDRNACRVLNDRNC